jgi:hypothetical protein
MKENINILRASNGYLYISEDRSLIELFSEGKEGLALGQLLQRIYQEFEAKGGLTLSIQDIEPDRSDEEGQYLVQRVNTGFVVSANNTAYLCRSTADLHKLLGDAILAAAEEYIERETYTVTIPVQPTER